MSVSTVRRRLASGRLEGRREERAHGFRWLVFIPDAGTGDRATAPSGSSIAREARAPAASEASAVNPVRPATVPTPAIDEHAAEVWAGGGERPDSREGHHEGATRTLRDHAVMATISLVLLTLAAALYVLPLAAWVDAVALAVAVVAVPIGGNEAFHLLRSRGREG